MLDTFFEKFELFAEAPNAVPKLRELILQLAVQGKLVEQNKDDPPATELLEHIQSEKAQRLKERVIRKQNTSALGEDEEPFSIPQSWVWTRLGEIGEWGSGSTPAREDHSLYGGGITWLKSGELNDTKALAGSSETVTHLALKTGSFRLNQRGDVLIAMYGATIGKLAILSEPAVTNQAVCGCTPFPGVLNLYLFNYLLSQRARFQLAGEGGAQPNISKVKIVEFPFPLPPLAEQKRIVAKVDELMALCDQLESQQRERATKNAQLAHAAIARFSSAPIPTNLDLLFHNSFTVSPADLRKVILNLAVQGKLVAQDVSDKPVENLLMECAEQRLQTIGDKEIPFEIPKPWQWCRLGCMAEFINGDRGKNYPHKSEYVPSGLPFINTGHIQPDGTLSLERMHYLTREKFDSLRSGKIKRGDLVYCLRGATLGKTAIVDYFTEGAIASSLVIIRLNEKLNERYVYYYLISPLGRELIKRFDNGSAQPNLSANSVKRYVMPVPPLAEQRRIVSKVDQLMTLVNELEAQLKESSSTAENLMEAIVAHLIAQE